MTVAVDYNSLVTQTFCDNAIRSVMMIDDEFLSYPALLERLRTSQNQHDTFIENSSRASELEIFFQSKNILCDIDNSAEHAHWDKIRKVVRQRTNFCDCVQGPRRHRDRW